MSAHAYNRQRTPLPFHIYRVYGRRGLLLYIGITTDMARRSREHGWGRGHGWRRTAKCVSGRLVGPQVVARAAEAAAIRDERPKHNDCIPNPQRAAARLQEHMQREGLTVAALALQIGYTEGEILAWLGKKR